LGIFLPNKDIICPSLDFLMIVRYQGNILGFKSFKNFDPSSTLFSDISGDIRGTDDGDFVTDASEDIFDDEDRLVEALSV
jgi:hypothetical protein